MPFQFFGDRVKAHVRDLALRRLEAAGKAGLAEAQRLVPVDTGQLKASLGYIVRQDDLTLVIYADATYAGHVEWGTSVMAAQPYLRPALAVAGAMLAKGDTVRIQTPTRNERT